MKSEEVGLVIGKFMPLHQGHLALLDFARSRCRRLVVLVGARPGEPIPGPLRLEWVREAIGRHSSVAVEYTEDDLPDAPQSDREVSRVWAGYLSKRFPEAGTIFSSEPYGDYLAGHMGIRHVPFDPDRRAVPVSATDIRQNPLRHWEYIPTHVRPHFVKKVCLYGPESTGKSMMAEQLARSFGTAFVPEMARVLFPDRMPSLEAEMQVIAESHAREINRMAPMADRVLFVDTDHLTTKIYWQDMFGRTPRFEPWIAEANRHDLYLLLDIDVPWVADPLRESGHLREDHRRRFRDELDRAGVEYVVISGGWAERRRRAEQEVVGRWPELGGQLINNQTGICAP